MDGPHRSVDPDPDRARAARRPWLAWLAILVACGCEARTAPSLRVGINAWPGYEILYLAEVQGLYEAQGVDVQIVQFASLNDGRRAFERGQVDGMACSAVELLQAANDSDRRPRAVWVTDWSTGGDMIVARRDLTAVPDLAGRRVAIEPGTLNLFILSRALELHGRSLADVTLVPLPQSKLVEAFAAGDLDAAATYPPTSTLLLAGGDAHPIFSTRELPEEVLDLVAFAGVTLERRPDDVARFLRAWEGALAWRDAHPDEANALMGRREGLSGAEFHAALTQNLRVARTSDQPRFWDGRLEQHLEEVGQTLVTLGEISAVPPASDLVELGPARQAVGGSPP